MIMIMIITMMIITITIIITILDLYCAKIIKYSKALYNVRLRLQ